MIITADMPDLVPARMLNELVFCPRLYFLEWVDRSWAANADTAEGDWQHRRVDGGGGAVPLPGEGEVKAARSVELASERLGITAKLDLLEGDGDGKVVPVDTKKGRPNRDGTSWEPDAVQVCAQVLLLREHGFTVDEGQIYYAETRQRIPVEITPELIDRTMSVVAQARAIAAKPTPPPPLKSSPKCGRCSLVGICLPDELNILTKRQVNPPRRLIASDPDSHPVYVTEQGAQLGIDGGRIVVSKWREELASTRLIDVLHVSVWGNVQITTQALRTFFDNEIAVFYFTYGGWLQGSSTGMPSKNVSLRIRQAGAAACGDLVAARGMIHGKIRNGRVLLRRNGPDSAARVVSQLAALAEQANEAASPASLLGIEGAAARLYFESLPALFSPAALEGLPGPTFTGLRNRRPPTDAVNCLLSFAYALLVKETMAASMIVGFDPYIGVFHKPRFGRAALALDLAEEFRPLLADSVVLTLINNREIGPSDFLVRAGAVTLTADGRRKVIRNWERRMKTAVKHPVFGYEVYYRRAIELQARILAAYLRGELPTYEPLVTR
jgi:CRISPR-associated protein Cas1